MVVSLNSRLECNKEEEEGITWGNLVRATALVLNVPAL